MILARGPSNLVIEATAVFSERAFEHGEVLSDQASGGLFSDLKWDFPISTPGLSGACFLIRPLKRRLVPSVVLCLDSWCLFRVFLLGRFFNLNGI